jgi:serine/threonine protein kinase
MIETIPAGTVLHRHYRIERVLGTGGFGHVYLATDLTTNQPCAVKEYLVTGEDGQEHLKHEARVLSHLHHENLPKFQDAFIEHERYYVVISYIEGNDLTDILRMARQRNETIPTPQLLNWVLAVCNAVMFMHSQKPIVIHRDIKPDNIRITSNGTAVLVDLGNAKAVADGARTLFFIRNQGTPGYAPPEQYPGGTGTDARSDVYALGGTLYFVLTAHEPPSVTARNQAIQQGRSDLPTLQEIIAKNPPEESEEAKAARQFRLGVSKPSKPMPRHSQHIAQLGSLPPQIVQQLNYIIQKAMAMRPRDRYQYVTDFVNDLHNVARSFPTSQPLPRHHSDTYSQGNAQPDFQKEQSSEHNSTQPMAEDITCPRCSLKLPATSLFCPRCGTKMVKPAQNSAQTPMLSQRVPPGSSHTPKELSDLNQQAQLKVSGPTPVVQRQHSESISRTPVTPGVPHRASQVTPQARSLPQQHSLPQEQPRYNQQAQTANNQQNSIPLLGYVIAFIILVLIVLALILATQGSAHAQMSIILHGMTSGVYALMGMQLLSSVIARVQFPL